MVGKWRVGVRLCGHYEFLPYKRKVVFFSFFLSFVRGESCMVFKIFWIKL